MDSSKSFGTKTRAKARVLNLPRLYREEADHFLYRAWARDGKELFFVTLDKRVVSVDVEPETEFRAGVPRPLFQVPELATTVNGLKLSVTRDGKRFLLVTAIPEPPITVLLNWTAALQK